jgi:Delta3-Delta2-enoyl-CoA isomerase
LLEAYRYKGIEALEDGIVDAVAPPETMLEVALEFAEKWKSKAKMGVYGVLRNELVGEATRACTFQVTLPLIACPDSCGRSDE